MLKEPRTVSEIERTQGRLSGNELGQIDGNMKMYLGLEYQFLEQQRPRNNNRN